MKTPLRTLMIIFVAIIIVLSSLIIYVKYSTGFQSTTDGKIQFKELGLLPGTNWTVTVKGADYTKQQTTNLTEMNFSSLRNGIYSYTVLNITGYSLLQSGQANISGNTGIIEIGDIHTSQASGFTRYPLKVEVQLNFTLITPSMGTYVTGSSNPDFYEIIVLFVTWDISLNYVNLTLVNTDGFKFTMTLDYALGKSQSLDGIWDVNISGPSYLAESTVIRVTEISGTTGDPAVSQFIFTDTLTGGVIGT